jgi:hypothetical protein
VLTPALSAAAGRSSTGRNCNSRPLQSPRPSRFCPVQPRLGGSPARASCVGPGGRVTPDPGSCAIGVDPGIPILISRPCRRLFRTSTQAISRPSFAEVVMAGVGGGRPGSGSSRARRGGRGGYPGRQLDGRGGREQGPPLPRRPVRGGGRERHGGRHSGPVGGVPAPMPPLRTGTFASGPRCFYPGCPGTGADRQHRATCGGCCRAPVPCAACRACARCTRQIKKEAQGGDPDKDGVFDLLQGPLHS